MVVVRQSRRAMVRAQRRGALNGGFSPGTKAQLLPPGFSSATGRAGAPGDAGPSPGLGCEGTSTPATWMCHRGPWPSTINTSSRSGGSSQDGMALPWTPGARWRVRLRRPSAAAGGPLERTGEGSAAVRVDGACSGTSSSHACGPLAPVVLVVRSCPMACSGTSSCQVGGPLVPVVPVVQTHWATLCNAGARRAWRATHNWAACAGARPCRL